MATVTRLEEDFHQAMLGLFDEPRTRYGFVAARFLQMVVDRSGTETAHRLLAAPIPGEGFAHLWELGRLDLTVEAQVLKPEWRELFTPEERSIARQRLHNLGFGAPWDDGA